MKRIVLDASVVLKWYLADESFSHVALGVLAQYVSNEIEIVAPSLIQYEVMNGLVIAQKRGRIKEEKIVAAVEGFLDLDIPLMNPTRFYQKTMHYCTRYSRSVYDASYLALAEVEGISLITADEGLWQTVHKDLKWVKRLGDI